MNNTNNTSCKSSNTTTNMTYYEKEMHQIGVCGLCYFGWAFYYGFAVLKILILPLSLCLSGLSRHCTSSSKILNLCSNCATHILCAFLLFFIALFLGHLLRQCNQKTFVQRSLHQASSHRSYRRNSWKQDNVCMHARVYQSGCLQLLEISWNFIDADGKFNCQLKYDNTCMPITEPNLVTSLNLRNCFCAVLFIMYITESACVCISHVIPQRLDQCKNPPGTSLYVFWKSPGNLLGWICRHPSMPFPYSF